MTAHIEDLLANVNGNTIISIDTCTEVALKGGKANPMKGRVHKIMVGGNVMVQEGAFTIVREVSLRDMAQAMQHANAQDRCLIVRVGG